MSVESLPRQNLSRHEFVSALELQMRFRGLLSEVAYQLPQYALGRQGFLIAPLLCQPDWIPASPLPLGTPNENLEDNTAEFETNASPDASNSNILYSSAFRRGVRQLLPISDQDGEPFDSLHRAIQETSRPESASFISRPSYSLSGVERGPPLRLRFRPAEYFDHMDCGELLALEFAHEWQRLEGSTRELSSSDLQILEERLLVRHHVGNWQDVFARPSLAGVNILTIFWDRRKKTATFPMMCRSKAVSSAQNTDHVIPAGEFQPTTGGPRPFVQHCTLWQTVLREFAEEILLDNEAKSYGRDMQDLARLPAIRPLVELMRSGYWRCYYLGVALDPLTLKAEIMLVSIIDKECFLDHVSERLIDRRLPIRNTEGEILRGADGWGEVLNISNLQLFLHSAKTLPAGRGCIEQFIRSHRSILASYDAVLI